ncbi:MAG: hypothetical protein IPM52_03460 [Bacteroidetes bacterium]|nr:hypothetical protein [Bacteroidota bacterium]
MSFKKIRLLQVQFENDIHPWEVPAFRGAVIATAGREHVLFHNHLKESYRYSYPLIQYKQVRNKPMIMSLDEGVDEIHHFFEHMQLGLFLGERPYELKISNLHLNQQTMQVWDKLWDYRIDNWLALNSENYQRYQEMDGLAEKIDLLQRTLTGNIISFAKGIDWTIEKPVKLFITNMREPRLVTYKGQKLMGFSVDFRTNVFLPNYLGLGKGASTGFGVVQRKREKLSENNS